MGYQVGNHCYATKAEAENVYFSLVVPVVANTTNTTAINISRPITTNQIKLIKPDYTNGRWLLNNQTIIANLPQCSPEKNMQEGLEIGWYVFSIMAALWVFSILKKQLR